MKVTVCQLPESTSARSKAYELLKDHVRQTQSDFLLLPEMPFAPWLARTNQADNAAWQQAVTNHQHMVDDYRSFGETVIGGTNPVLEKGAPRNEAFIWSSSTGLIPVHQKYYLPEEDLFWEASWYERGPKAFDACSVIQGEHHFQVGFLICTEMWFTDHARTYARQGVQLLLSPRATAGYSKDKWLAGGRAAAVMAGAFCLSSNRGGVDESGLAWAGCGWIISPEGDVLGTTDDDNPFLTLDIDLHEADIAKSTYPRYVPE